MPNLRASAGAATEAELSLVCRGWLCPCTSCNPRNLQLLLLRLPPPAFPSAVPIWTV